jgi:hypothetical protein
MGNWFSASPSQKVLDLCSKGNLRGLESFLQDHPEFPASGAINTIKTPVDGLSPLMLTAKLGFVDVARFLVTVFLADVNLQHAQVSVIYL